jgi:protocatechuate 3,4-dioxygenase beta subunit
MKKWTNLMRWLASFTLVGLALTGCGGDNSITDPDGADDDGGNSGVASLALISSAVNLGSDGSAPVTLSAIARDTNNNVVEGATVIFSTDSGALAVINSVTDASGVAQAELNTAGNPANRTITVNASSGGQRATLQVNVVGTLLSVSGPQTVVQGDSPQYTVRLQNSGGGGIPGQLIDVQSALGNAITASSLTTNAEGEVQFNLNAEMGGAETLTASGLGLISTLDVDISGDSFRFLSPAEDGVEIDIDTDETLMVEWLVNGVAQSGTVEFFTTRGVLSAPSATLNANGRASVDIRSTTAGPAVATAAVVGGPSTQRTLEFVATMPTQISAQAGRFSLAPGEQSTVTATVRDANDNPVKNALVSFVLQDVTGGSISVAAVRTDSSGRAETVYTAGQTTGATDGVRITASVNNGAISDEVRLTVARREVFISIGTGNDIEEPNTADYLKEFSVRVTDSQGVGVEGAQVQISAVSKAYWKGYYVIDDTTNQWAVVRTSRDPDSGNLAACQDEDLNRNGILDVGEDRNGSGRIEAGNVASVSPGTVSTDTAGLATFDLTYAQGFANWVVVTIEARTSVAGTEFLETQDFLLPASVQDLTPPGSPPGGTESRYGSSDTCLDTL